jgi:hypothetical protein
VLRVPPDVQVTVPRVSRVVVLIRFTKNESFVETRCAT